MAKIKDKMEEVKVETYKDCVWYLSSIDKCKLQMKPKQYCDCTCKDNIDAWCVWITKFLKSSPEGVGNRDIRDDSVLLEYGFLLGDYDPAKRTNVIQSLMDAIKEEDPFEG